METTTKTTTQAVQKSDRETSYVPFGATDKITLTANLVKRYLCKPTRSGAFPTEDDCIRFVMLCASKRLNPWEQDAFLVGYDGKNGAEFSLITSIQSLYKRAESNPTYNGMKSGVIVQTEAGTYDDVEGDFYPDGAKLVGGWAEVFNKGRDYSTKSRVKLSTFNKGTKFWLDNPAGQIVKCAEADALRRAFPTLCGGIATVDEGAVLDVPAVRVEMVKLAQPKRQELPPGEGTPEETAASFQAMQRPAKKRPALDPAQEDGLGDFFIASRSRQPAPAHTQEDADNQTDGDLGPQERPAAGPQMTRLQAELSEMMAESGVEFDDFRGFCKVSHKVFEPENWTGYIDVSEQVIIDLRANSNRVALKIIRAYGKAQ